MSEPLIAYWFAMADKQGRAYSPNKPDEKWEVGKKRTLRGQVVPCRYGFHGSPTLWQALEYAPGPLACKVELGGTIVRDSDKLVASQKTLLAAVNVERELRLFAADCAEHVLHIFELEYPNNDRPRKAIAAARDYADGRIDYAAMVAAKSAAEWAAESAAAARAAAARAAAMVAAKSAAMVAAKSAAMVAAKSAARAAAESAAAARAAAAEWAAAMVAARTAAESAAAAAEWAAQREWQRRRFEELLAGIFSEGAA